MYKKFIYTAIFTLIITQTWGQSVKAPLVSAIKEADLLKDITEMSDDSFRGREAVTIDELRSAVWFANKMRDVGIKPAGEDGTYFQFFDLFRSEVMPISMVKIGERSLQLEKDILIPNVIRAKVDAPILYLENVRVGKELESIEAKDKAVVINASMDGIVNNISLFEKRYPGFVANKYYKTLSDKGASALILIADDLVEKNWSVLVHHFKRGSTGIKGFRDKITDGMPVIWLHKNEIDFIKNVKGNLQADIRIQLYKYPSLNVIGKIEGTDPNLKEEYVLFSGHHDYLGMREPIGNDSIDNGADDNASANVALLAFGRAFNKQPGKRSALFISHGAEEFGLLGSNWYSTHPTVPQKNIVAVLNSDLIANNDIDSAALLGAFGRHKTSDELVTAALEANDEGPKFEINKEWDSPNHPEYFFFRSDHIPYARVNIPVLFYTSMLTKYYHTPLDDIDHINIKKLHKMVEWMYRTGWKVTNMPERPKYLPDVNFER